MLENPKEEESDIKSNKNIEGDTKSKRTSTVIKNSDGTTTVTDIVTKIKPLNEIKMDPNAEIQSFKVEATSEDTRYINALYLKKEVAIIEGNNNLICIIPLNSLKKIFQLFDETIEMSFDRVSYGIYSTEEIIQFKQMVHYHNNEFKNENEKRYLEYNLEYAKKLRKGNLNEEQLNNAFLFYQKLKNSQNEHLNKSEKKLNDDNIDLKGKNKSDESNKKKNDDEENLKLNKIKKEEELILEKSDEEKKKLKLKLEEEQKKKEEEEKKLLELKKKKEQDEIAKKLIFLQEQITSKQEKEKSKEISNEKLKPSEKLKLNEKPKSSEIASEKSSEKLSEKLREKSKEKDEYDEKLIMTSSLPSDLYSNKSGDFIQNKSNIKNNNEDKSNTLENAMKINTTKSGIPLPVENKKNVKANILVSNIEPEFENEKKIKKPQKKQIKKPEIKNNDNSPINKNVENNKSQEPKKQKKKVIKKVIKKVQKHSSNSNYISDLVSFTGPQLENKQIYTENPKTTLQYNISHSGYKPNKYNNNQQCMICKGLPVRPQECINCHRQICTLCTYELEKSGFCDICNGRIEPINRNNNNNNIRFESNITKFQPKNNLYYGNENTYNTMNTKEFYEQNKDRFMNDTWKDDKNNYNSKNTNNTNYKSNLNLEFCECDLCGKSFPNENEKINHMNKAHNDKNINFNKNNFKRLLNNKSNQKGIRQQSVGAINLYICKYCNKTFGNKATRAAHIKNIHGEDDDEDNNDENINKNNQRKLNKNRSDLSIDFKNNTYEKRRKRLDSWFERYPCENCSQIFDNLNSLEYHMKNIHKKNLDEKNYLKNSMEKGINNNSTEINKNLDYFPCDYCSKVYNNIKELKEHTRDKHNKIFDEQKYLTKLNEINTGKTQEQYPEKYPCEYCNKTYNNLNTLIHHNNIDHNIEINKDEYLNKLNSKNNLNDNYTNLKKGCLNNYYPCQYCNKVYNNFNTLSNHVKNDHGKSINSQNSTPKTNKNQNQIVIKPNEHYCRYCLKKFPSIIQRDNHISAIHKITPFEEDKYRPLNYSKDIDRNSNNNHFCRHCGKNFLLKDERDLHLKNSHLINEDVINQNVQYILDKKKDNIDEDEMYYNNRRRYDLECKYCLRPFNSLKYLYQHMYEMHHIPINKNEENIPSNLEKEFECKYCNKTYNNLKSINYHLISAHHINENLSENEIHKSNHIKLKTKNLDDYFYCDNCGQVFNYRPNYISHLKEIHGISKINNSNSKISYKSDEEGNYDSIKKKLNDNEYERNKLNLTFKNGKYECNYCKKNYPNYEKCEKHIKRHHYYPDYYPQNPTSVIQGIKVKKGQFECDFCGIIYNYYNDCVRHISRHHLNDTNKIEEIPHNLIQGCNYINGKFDCNFCNKSYVLYKDCEKHIIKHHLNNKNDNDNLNNNNYGVNYNFSRVKRSEYNCFFCKQILKSKSLYISHLRDYHKIEFEDNVHLYDSCDKTSYRIQTEFLK